jgi:4-amino-4-deoxy-L-arabinose transferase-like glycosyltransferase
MTLLKGPKSLAADRKPLLLAVPVLLATLVTFWNLTSLGLSHWDEYNYIETAEWFLRKPGAAFTIYEPPGFPFIVAIFFRLFGVRDYVAIAVSAVFAVATVALVAYLGIRLFGLTVGLTAPILLMITPLFIIYSRMALTDIAFTFFFSLALVAMYAAVRHGSRWNIAFAGIALGICTMIKYNGFMPVPIFLIYCLIALRSVRKCGRFRAALRGLRVLILTCVPSVVLGLLFISFLGLSTRLPENRVFSLHAAKLMVLEAPEILANGFTKFGRAAVLYHAGQLAFLPFASAPYYLQVLVYFVPVPVLLLAMIGLLRRDLRDGPELFVAVWLVASFFLVSSIGVQYSRAILPALPPLALCASLGLSKIKTLTESLSISRPRVKLRALAPLLLILVVVLSLQGVVQAVSFEHHGYRDAAALLTATDENGPVLADTQLVIGFYRSVNFGGVNTTNLARNRYLVVDFIADENGYAPVIQQLTQEGRLKLLETLPADLPPEVYLDTMSFTQVSHWNYTYIHVYEIENATASVS